MIIDKIFKKLQETGIDRVYIKLRMTNIFIICTLAHATNPFLTQWQYTDLGTWENYAYSISACIISILFTFMVFNKYIKKLVEHYKIVSNITLAIEVVVDISNIILDNPTVFFWSQAITAILVYQNFCDVEEMVFNKFYKSVNDKTVFNKNIRIIRNISVILGSIIGILMKGNVRLLLILDLICTIIDNREGYICYTLFDEDGKYIGFKKKNNKE